MPARAMIGSRTRGALSAGVAVVALVLAVRWFLGRWDATFTTSPGVAISWGWVVIGGAMLAVHAVSSALLWRQVVAATGARFTFTDAVDSFAPTLLARYIPGKVWANGFRVFLAHRVGVPLGATTGAMAWEALLVLLTAGVFGVLGGRRDAMPAASDAAFLLIAVTVGAWIVLAFLARSSRGAALLAHAGGVRPVRSLAAIARGIGIASVGWILYGAAHLAFARSVAPVAVTDFMLVGGAVALAWAGGFIAFVMPVGLGVRDGIQLSLLTPLLGPGPALLFVAVSRIGQLTTDMVLTAAWSLSRLRSSRRQRR